MHRNTYINVPLPTLQLKRMPAGQITGAWNRGHRSRNAARLATGGPLCGHPLPVVPARVVASACRRLSAKGHECPPCLEAKRKEERRRCSPAAQACDR